MAQDRTEFPGWREALRVYLSRPVIIMLFLGFSAGLPFLLVFSTLSAWLTEAGLSHTAIGFFSWIGITYSIKVVWAPVVDRLPLPGLTRWLGRRRGWLLPAQLGIAVGLVGMAFTDPVGELTQLVLFALCVAFSSATQDVVIDAYRIEAAEPERQGAMAASYILGYRLALLAAGAGSFYIASFGSWPAAYLVMAALVGVGVLTTLAIREPRPRVARDAALEEARAVAFVERNDHLPRAVRTAGGFLIGAVVCPLLDFFHRYGRIALAVLVLVGFYRLSDITMGVMANPFYLDLGFSKQEIASVSKIFGFFMTIGGSLLGGVLVVRFGILRPLLLGGLLVAGTNLLFAALVLIGPELEWLAVVIAAENLAGGLAGAAFIAWLSSLTSTAYTATQYALFSSLMTLPAKFLGGFSGVVVDGAGYFSFFLYTALLGLPAVLLILFLMTRGRGAQENAAAQDPV